MNRIVLDKEEVIQVFEDLEIIVEKGKKKKLYLFSLESHQISITLMDQSSLEVVHCALDCSDQIEVYLNGLESTINYSYRHINISDHKLSFSIFHNQDHTHSFISCHGLNKENASLCFDINPKVEKNAFGCTCNQENRIINLKEGSATICPNLLIDNFDGTSNHSAYIGNFSEEEIFYLMSRGLSRKTSNELLLRNFLIGDHIIEEKIPQFVEEIKKL